LRDAGVARLVAVDDVQLENVTLKARLDELERTLVDRDLTIASLQRIIADRDAAIADRDAKLAKFTAELAVLQAAVKRLLAPRRGGHLVPEGQGLLFSDAALLVDDTPLDVAAAPVADLGEPDGPAATPPPSRPRGKRKVDTTGLPREERIHELPEHQRMCPVTGLPLVPIGEKVFEELDFTRAKLFVVRHRQIVYGLPPAQAAERKVEPVTTELPPRPLDNCAASARLLAWLLVQKYGNHLPLYRQEQIFGRDGLRLPRQTLCDWALAAAELLRPLADCLMQEIRAGPVMQLDDTPVKCQAGKGLPLFQGYLWTFVNPEVDGVVYRFTPGRGSDLLAVELGGFAGTLVGDGYSGHKAAANKVDGVIAHAGCWAHVYRKFREAAAEAPGTARLFRADIKRLYAIEDDADERQLDAAARAELRQAQARPILAALYARARRVRHEHSEAGAMGKALTYLINQHVSLRRYLDDGRIPIDNNACEGAIRPIAIGRRNWLFAGSVRGGQAAAVVYSLIECCRRAKVEMVAYLADVLVRIRTQPASQLAELLPATWRPEAPTPAPQPVPALT
jgi:transposase